MLYQVHYIHPFSKSIGYVQVEASNQDEAMLKAVQYKKQWAREKCNMLTIKEEEWVACPVCKKGRMILRKNRQTNSSFFGCSKYPDCTFTKNG